MPSRTCGLSLAALLALLLLPGCGNNTLNPFCGSARPAPLIGSLSPSTMTFAEVQQGDTLTVSGSALWAHRRSSSTPRRSAPQLSAINS